MKKNHKQAQSNKQRKNSSLNSYAKYSSLSIQMVIIVLAGAYGGVKLDKWIQWKFPLFTLLFSILGVAIAIYIAVKDFLKK